jgi:Na+/melibiose symporter-like transporter
VTIPQIASNENLRQSQRTTSLRFFFIALAVFVAAWVGVLTTNLPITNTYRAGCGLVLSFAAMIITLCFGRLDTRNKQLVESSEALIKEIERELAASLKIRQFETTLNF